jgi:hypothetical protein
VHTLEKHADDEDLVDALFVHGGHNAGALDSAPVQSYLHHIPFHRFPAAHSCARRFFVWEGLSSDEMGHRALWS